MGKRCYCLHECSLRSQFFPRLLQRNPQIPVHILQGCLKMLRLVITALVIAAAGTIHIDTTDGGYEGVKVSIHDSVLFNEAILENLKEMFRAASIFLHRATNGSVYFKSIRIEFPHSWPKRDHARAVSSNSFQRSDVRINLPTETTGDEPFTQNPRICGKHGDFIQLTPRFLAQTQNMTAGGSDFTAYMFVHEWAHLRYGVFDEFGSLGDAAYPPLYCQNGSVRLNGCSKNLATAGNVAKCIGPNCTIDPSCKITPRISVWFPVESSIMFLPYMGSDVKYFCDNKGGIRQHNYKAPSMQNALCKQRSTWDVISKHPDFQHLAMRNLSKIIQVNFEEVQQKEPLAQRVVLVLDASLSMRILTSPKETAEDGVIVLITDGEENKKPMIKDVLPKLVKGKVVVSTVGLVSAVDEKLVELAVSTGGKAFTMLDSSWPRDSILEEVFESTTSTKNDINWEVSEDSDEVLTKMTTRRSLTDCEVGTNTEVHMTKNNAGAVAARLVDCSDRQCKDCHITDGTGHKHIPIPTPAKQLMKRHKESTNTFIKKLYVSSQTGNNTEVRLRTNHTGNITVRVVKPSGQVCNKCDIKLDGNDTLILLPTPAEVGNWTLYISSSASVLRIRTVMRSRVTNTDNRAVLHCELLSVNLTKPEEAVVYAWLKQGDRVFKDAVFVAEVSAPEPPYNSTKFRLYDDGKGADNDPDDGWYSGYFSTFSGKGKYPVKVRVQTQNTTRLGFPRNRHAGIGLGLGSSLKAPSGYPDVDVQEPPPPIIKQCGFFSAKTDIFYWQVPPAYVSDLRATAFVPKPNGTLLVQLTWTWPGAHMLTGNASGVIIRASEDIDQLKENFDNQTQITSVVQGNLDPLPPGSKHVVTIALPPTFASLGGDGEYRWNASIAIRVMNSYGLSSETSWVVDVSHTPQGIETWVTATTGAEETVTTETATPTDKEDSESSAWFPVMCVGIIILLVGVALLAYLTAIRKGTEENARNDVLTGETSKSQEEPLTK